MSVPADALDTLVSIRVGVLWGKQFVPSLEEDAALLSPVVCCEPRGLTFRKWVTLTMPHCAVNPTTDWQLEVSFTLCKDSLLCVCSLSNFTVKNGKLGCDVSGHGNISKSFYPDISDQCNERSY